MCKKKNKKLFYLSVGDLKNSEAKTKIQDHTVIRAHADKQIRNLK